jgi:hypothetical protein
MYEGTAPASVIQPTGTVELADTAELANVAGQAADSTGQAGHGAPMTVETARRLAALLAPHLLAMRAVTAGTPYGACTGPDSAATSAVATGTGTTSAATAGQASTASAATRIFIAGMLERISA